MNALVTGASSGIGRDIAQLLSARGYHLILVARRQEELDSLAVGLAYGATVITADLGVPGAALALFEECRRRELPVEVLVNNAGFGRVDEHVEIDVETLESMNHLNVTCLSSLCRLFGQDMKERGHGSILNVGSTACYVPIPLMSNYAATKSFVASFTRGFRAEMAGHGVQVSLLNPGPTETEFGQRASDDGQFLERKPGIMTSLEVAKAGVEGLFADRAEILPVGMNQALPFVVRLFPYSWLTKLAHTWVKR